MLSSQPPKPAVKPPEKPVVKIEIHKELAGFLALVKEDKCVEDMKLNFSWHKISRESFASLIQAILLGNCKRGLAINLTGHEELNLDLLFDALASGKCPADMKINLSSNNIRSDGVLKLIKAIQQQNFPQGCTIDLTNNRFIGSIMENKMKEAIEESKSGVKVITSSKTVLFKQLPPAPVVEVEQKPALTEEDKKQTEDYDDRLERPRSKL
jgi:hypothetical protein